MKQFNDDNFVLETKLAQDLYHKHAAHLPIIDYHCHLIPEMVAKVEVGWRPVCLPSSALPIAADSGYGMPVDHR